MAQEQKQQFEDGSLVQLKSGGPIMTIQGYSSPGVAVCTWFDTHEYYGKRLFFDYMLIQVKKG